MNLDDLLGINPDDPVQRLARELLKEDDDLLSELVRLRRESMTQQQVADRLQISRPAVAAFERYDSDPRLSAVRRYALAIRASVRHSVSRPEVQEDVVYEMLEQTRAHADEQTHHERSQSDTRLLHRQVRDQFEIFSFAGRR